MHRLALYDDTDGSVKIIQPAEGVTYKECCDIIAMTFNHEAQDEKEYEDREARLDLINVHATMSKLFDRVCQLERECAELRIQQAQHELANHRESNHVTPLQDRVVAIGRNRRRKSVDSGNIPWSFEVGDGSIGSEFVRYMDGNNTVSLRSYPGFGRSSSCNRSVCSSTAEGEEDKRGSGEGHSISEGRGDAWEGPCKPDCQCRTGQ